MVATQLPGVSRGVSSRRRMKNRIFTMLVWASGLIALVPLTLIIAYVIGKGASALNLALFTKEPNPPGLPGGGIVQSFIGSGIIVGIAVLFSIPLGLLTGVYLSEYGHGKMASSIRFVAAILLSTPSIVAGAFIWAVVVVAMGTFSGFAGALALTVLMWPILALATEEILKLVPNDLREAGLALGLPRWRVILRVVVPTAGSGIFTAIMLATARGLGETAPILLTALGNEFINTNPGAPTDAVPLRIYFYAGSPVVQFHAIAWAAAITLLVAVLALSITARILSYRQMRRTR